MGAGKMTSNGQKPAMSGADALRRLDHALGMDRVGESKSESAQQAPTAPRFAHGGKWGGAEAMQRLEDERMGRTWEKPQQRTQARQKLTGAEAMARLNRGLGIGPSPEEIRQAAEAKRFEAAVEEGVRKALQSQQSNIQSVRGTRMLQTPALDEALFKRGLEIGQMFPRILQEAVPVIQTQTQSDTSETHAQIKTARVGHAAQQKCGRSCGPVMTTRIVRL